MGATDGLLMSLAYGWASIRPGPHGLRQNAGQHRLSVAISCASGRARGHEPAPAGAQRASRTTGFWGLMSRFNINTAGFVIVGLFLATWLAALLIWRYARIEEKWSLAPSPARPAAPRD